MHELAIMDSVVAEVVDRIDERVVVVRLAIGELAGVDRGALESAFDVCTRGTALEAAALDIVAVPGRARCRACSGEQAMRSLVEPCACGSFDRELLAGTEVRLVEVEVA